MCVPGDLREPRDCDDSTEHVNSVLRTTSTRILGAEFAVTHSDPPIKTRFMCVRSPQGHPQFKDGTAYRQVRPTNLYKIKNFHLEIQVSSLTLALG